MSRKLITNLELDEAVAEMVTEIERRLNEKGYGSYASIHEILGIMKEEADKELTDAVHANNHKQVRKELLDCAVTAIFGIACINSGKLDW